MSKIHQLTLGETQELKLKVYKLKSENPELSLTNIAKRLGINPATALRYYNEMKGKNN